MQVGQVFRQPVAVFIGLDGSGFEGGGVEGVGGFWLSVEGDQGSGGQVE
jgi:hypothetical protein